ncbi:peptidoglycan-binding domain-containing protein [Streptomyces sp. NPDC004856]|uniref:peptidoglycan-binding domain-containing protein n=1 Tax=Streptomyces sp. NPDC004856 TaxID=3154556 RepID=UPI0033BE0FBB
MSDDRRTCPECGALEGADGAPTCDCEPEAFAPLRVRPYVSLSEPSQPAPPRAADPYAYPPPPKPVEDDTDDDEPREPKRHGRILLLSAVTAVLSVATLVTVLITSPGDENAAASDTTAATATAALPTSPRAPAPTRTSSSPPAPSASASATPTHSPTPSASATPTAKKSTAKPKAHDRRPSAAPTRSASATPTAGTTLRRGDSGRDVLELQWRLKRLNLYVGELTGDYDDRTQSSVTTYQLSRGIRSDKQGEYGPATRTALERETASERGRRH